MFFAYTALKNRIKYLVVVLSTRYTITLQVIQTNIASVVLFLPFVVLSLYWFLYQSMYHVQLVLNLAVYDFGSFTPGLPLVVGFISLILKTVWFKLMPNWTSPWSKLGSTLVFSTAFAGFLSYYFLPPLMLVVTMSQDFTLFHNGVFSNIIYSNNFWIIRRTLSVLDIETALLHCLAAWPQTDVMMIKNQLRLLLSQQLFTEATVCFHQFKMETDAFLLMSLEAALTPKVQPTFHQLYGSDILLGVGIGLIFISLVMGGFSFFGYGGSTAKGSLPLAQTKGSAVFSSGPVKSVVPGVFTPGADQGAAAVSVKVPVIPSNVSVPRLGIDQTCISWGGVDGNHLIRVVETYFKAQLKKGDPVLNEKLTMAAYEDAVYKGLQPLLYKFHNHHQMVKQMTPVERTLAMKKVLVDLEKELILYLESVFGS